MKKSDRRRGGRYAKPRQPKKSRTLLPILAAGAAVCLLLWLCLRLFGGGDQPKKTEPGTLPTLPAATAPPTTEAEPEKPVATATLGAMGDLLIHKPIIKTAAQEGGKYDFTPIFEYLKPYISELDYGVANLETTLGGADCGTPYQGNPLFNCPDEIVDAAGDGGFDMLLTANNHCADTWAEGIIRTAEQVRQRGLANLGTRADKNEKAYSVIDVNGIRLGMLSYTYATGVTADGRPQFNYNAYVSKAGLVNFFTESNLSRFYDEVQAHLDAMKADGAEATVLYLHWGAEYKLEATDAQKAMAQKLCDMGVDVIIGGHPHVVEPIDLISSTVDPDHKTLVIYSLGNAVSNQRRELMRLNTGHTEDGALFTVTFEKYADGRVRISDAHVLPTWVKMTGTQNAPKGYFILPLDTDCQEQWQDLYDLDDAAYSETLKSYSRTMEIVGPGLEACRTYFEQTK